MTWTSNNLNGQRSATANIREDLSNMISNIDRDESPFVSSIGTNKATGKLHEWLTDVYDTPGENVAREGFTFEASNDGIDSANTRQQVRTRLNNNTQIYGKNILASGSVISSDVAGVANEFAYQLKKAGVETKRDIDYSLLTWVESGNENNVVKAGTADLNETGSVFSYASNWYNNTTTGSILREIAGSSATNAGSSAKTAGQNVFGSVSSGDDDGSGFSADGTSTINFAAAPTRVSFSRDSLEGLLAQMYNDGAKPNVCMIPTRLKSSVSSGLIDGSNDAAAQRRADAMAKKLNLAVLGVMTDFGFDLALVPSYIMDQHSGAGNAILVYDSSKVKRSVLTPMTTEEDRVARYGRAAIMYCEETLEVMNPRSVGVIVGVS